MNNALNVGLLDRIYHTGGIDLAESLRGLSNCEAPFLTRGGGAILTKAAVGRRDAGVTIGRLFAKPDDEYSVAPRNGRALDVIGGMKMLGPLMGGFFWGKAKADWVNVAGGAAWVSYVDVEVVRDHIGTAAPIVRTVRVYLPRSTTRDPNVRTNDIIAFQIDRSGTAFCTSEVYDGKIGEIRDLGLGEDPTDYPMRGWDIADGGGGTDNLSGDNSILYGYTGAGVYTGTAGTTAVAHSFTATISGNGGTVALTIASAVTGITVNEHTDDTAHVHTMSGSDVAGLLDDHVLSSHTHTVAHNGTDGTGDPGTVDAAYGGGSWTTSSGGGATLSHAGSGSVNTGSTDMVLPHTVNDSGHGHSGSTVASNSIASTLSIGTPTGNRPAGILIVRVQRVS